LITPAHDYCSDGRARRRPPKGALWNFGRVWSAFAFLFLATAALAQEPSAVEVPVSRSSAEPLIVDVGILLNQVTFVDQKSENFGVVATITMRWTDPAFDFDAATYGRDYKLLTADAFVAQAQEIGTVIPFFVFENQQGQRWEHEAFVAILPDGDIRFVERSTLTLQAPHFDFTRFPFDTQKFFLEISSINPIQDVQYRVLGDQWGLSETLGEEAWILTDEEMVVSEIRGATGLVSSHVALGFAGHRHIQYYMLRIFLPILLLVAVSWISFFLEDYRKRIDVAGANLLVFVAFNFAISDSLPQLGYVTFLDFFLQLVFFVTAASIVLNVILRRMQIQGHEAFAHKIDNYVIKWIFPIGYGAAVAFAVYRFLL